MAQPLSAALWAERVRIQSVDCLVKAGRLQEMETGLRFLTRKPAFLSLGEAVPLFQTVFARCAD
jgi:hypothetical protein